MSTRFFCTWALALLVGLILVDTTRLASAACKLNSATDRSALVELYTSEGCNSCPPADRWLSNLRRPEDAGLIALAFHVDYWNRLGWVDRFSQAAFSDRHRQIASRQRSRAIYTPQVIVDGRDFRSWRDPSAFSAAVAEIRRDQPGAQIRGSAERDGQFLHLNGEVRLRDRAVPAAAFIAVVENGLITEVRAGENAGRKLSHDYVVRALVGPLPPTPDGTIALNQALRLDRSWRTDQLGVAVFVQNPATGEVLQAAARYACLK